MFLGAMLLPLTPALALTPNDPLLFEQWYLEKIGVPKAWDVTLGDPSVIVAVIDSGVDIDHPDLAGNIWTNPGEIPGDGIDNDGDGFVDDVHGWDFLTNTSDPRPKVAAGQEPRFGFHHGTAIAGIIAAAANNGRGIAGVAPKVKMMPLRALDSDGSGNTSTVIRAMEYAIAHGASVVNLSFVSTVQQPAGSVTNNTALFRVMERARKAGIVVVASAGNEAAADRTEVVDLDVSPQVPVCEAAGNPFQAVIGVSSTDQDDHRSTFSSYGSRCIDVSAPGNEFFVLTAARQPSTEVAEESYSGYYRGTSLSAAVVSGVAALIKSANPALTADQIQTIIEQTADPVEKGTVYDGKIGKGRINAAAAVQRAVASAALPVSVINPSSQPLAVSVSPTVVVTPAPPPVIPKKIERDAVLLGVYAGGVSRLLRTDLLDASTASLEEFLRLPGNITHVVQLKSRDIVLARTQKNKPTEILIITPDGVPVRSWLPFGAGYRGDVSLASGDLDGDGSDKVVVGSGVGAVPEVRVFTVDGKRIAAFLAYGKDFRGGVEVAVGDVRGDAMPEIITVPQSKGTAQVRIFDHDGRLAVQFFAAEKTFRSGASLALVADPKTKKKQIAIGTLRAKHGDVSLLGGDGKLQVTFRVFDTIDRPFALGFGVSGMNLLTTARTHPTLVGIFSGEGKRRGLLPLPKGIEEAAITMMVREKIVL